MRSMWCNTKIIKLRINTAVHLWLNVLNSLLITLLSKLRTNSKLCSKGKYGIHNWKNMLSKASVSKLKEGGPRNEASHWSIGTICWSNRLLSILCRRLLFITLNHAKSWSKSRQHVMHGSLKPHLKCFTDTQKNSYTRSTYCSKLVNSTLSSLKRPVWRLC